MLTQRSQEAHTGPPLRGTSRQLALPLPTGGPPASWRQAADAGAGGPPTRPGQVWARLPLPVRAEVRRVVWRVWDGKTLVASGSALIHVV
jgi:hypothetical protein